MKKSIELTNQSNFEIIAKLQKDEECFIIAGNHVRMLTEEKPTAKLFKKLNQLAVNQSTWLSKMGRKLTNWFSQMLY